MGLELSEIIKLNFRKQDRTCSMFLVEPAKYYRALKSGLQVTENKTQVVGADCLSCISCSGLVDLVFH